MNPCFGFLYQQSLSVAIYSGSLTPTHTCKRSVLLELVDTHCFTSLGRLGRFKHTSSPIDIINTTHSHGTTSGVNYTLCSYRTGQTLPLKQWHTGVFASQYTQVGYQSISKNMPYTMKPIEAVSFLPFVAEPLTKARHH